MLPLALALDSPPNVEQAFLRLAQKPHCVFFDSSLRHPTLGRYSFLAADPFAYFEVPADGSDALAELAQRVEPYAASTAAGLPPFQGGAAGVLAYEMGRSLETIPSPRNDEFRFPALAIGLYDVVLAVDHEQDRAWIVSQGFPAREPNARRRRASERLEEMRSWLYEPAEVEQIQVDASAAQRLPQGELAPQFDVERFPALTSDFSADDYLAAVERAIEYIRAGDVFQVNLSQRLLYPAEEHAVSLYLRLRKRNAATFAGYFDLGAFQICSASPERFLRIQADAVEARPIKGTRARTAWPEADLFAGDDLKQSEKDRAENVMIADLLRNDLSRVCRPESIYVPQLCGLEVYSYVQHLVSVVCGQLKPGCTPLDCLRAAFPGGSITGAPKIRAMELIAELEPTARGPYCGSLAYLGFDGALDTSILIRTVTAGQGWWQLPVGGGIVAQSEPRREYEETWHKAEGILRALKP